MNRRLFFSAILLAATASCAESAYAEGKNPVAAITTSMGVIEVELDQKNAPLSVANFISYARSGAYNGTIFHRVINGFMVQGGGFDTRLEKRPTQSPIKNEAQGGLKNKRGTLAMARTSDPHSATNQFFINVADNAFLDHTAPDARGFGYAVFGTVVKGMDVVDRIKSVPTGSCGPFAKDCPTTQVVITQVVIK